MSPPAHRSRRRHQSAPAALSIVTSGGMGSSRPFVAVRHGADGVLAPADPPGPAGGPSGLAWSVKGRAPFTPTPLAYRGLVYVLATNGVLDAYDVQTGAEVYRARVPELGSGFSASPVAADGKNLPVQRGRRDCRRRGGSDVPPCRDERHGRADHGHARAVAGRPVRPHDEQRVCDWAHGEALNGRPVIEPVVAGSTGRHYQAPRGSVARAFSVFS